MRKSRNQVYEYKFTSAYQGMVKDGKGLSGKGRLTISRIDDMQSFYGHAIRNNKGNVKKCRRKYGLFCIITQAQ